MSDARERRRERAASNKSKNIGKTIKRFRTPAIIVVLWFAIVAFQYAQATGAIGPVGKECPGHWHPVMSVQVEGSPVFFSHPSFQEHGTGGAAGFHVHDASGVLHMHPSVERCIPLRAGLGHLAIKASSSGLELGDEYGPQAGTYATNETHTLRLFAQKWGSDTWKEKSLSYLDEQPSDGERLLLTYGASSDADIEAQQAVVPQVPSSYTPPPPEEGIADKHKVGMMATSIFAIVALFIWNAVRKTKA